MKKKSDISKIRKQLEKDNRARPLRLTQIPRETWPEAKDDRLIEVWVSQKYLVQVYDEGNEYFRLSISRTQIDERGQWQDGLSWDELMECKRQVGRGDVFAVEVYPPDKDVVNVANMRHVFTFPESICGWVNS